MLPVLFAFLQNFSRSPVRTNTLEKLLSAQPTAFRIESGETLLDSLEAKHYTISSSAHRTDRIAMKTNCACVCAHTAATRRHTCEDVERGMEK